MKRKRYVWQPIVIGGTLICMLGQNVFAKEGGNEKDYTYTVTLYSGNQGILSEKSGITVDNHSTGSKYQINALEKGGEKLRITGLQYGDVISVSASNAVKLKQDSPYYVKGVRKSGRDNGTVGASAFSVRGDEEYVVAYGIKGDMVSYIVNYQDTQGKTLAESEKFYGMEGEQPVVAFRYIENYQPNSYNLTRTLSKNEAENVFTFVYQEIPNEVSVEEERTIISQSESRREGSQRVSAQGQAENVQGETENGIANEAEGMQEEETENERETAQDDKVEKEEVKEIINLDEEELEKEKTSDKKEKEESEEAESKKNIPLYLGGGVVATGGIGALTYRIIRRRRSKVKGK